MFANVCRQRYKTRKVVVGDGNHFCFINDLLSCNTFIIYNYNGQLDYTLIATKWTLECCCTFCFWLFAFLFKSRVHVYNTILNNITITMFHISLSWLKHIHVNFNVLYLFHQQNILTHKEKNNRWLIPFNICFGR